MSEVKGHILWIDDEIELLRSHILFLEEKGYKVSVSTNGDDAIEFLREKGKDIDLILLDEIMPGKGGLQTLLEIKEILPGVPVVMVTKNEEESLMEEAIGLKISDYLTKPVNPSQILMVCKKFIEAKKIASEKLTMEYLQGFRAISNALMTEIDFQDWIEIYLRLTKWDIELDEHPEIGLKDSLFELKRQCNVEFGKYIERVYSEWIESEDRPTLSVDIVEKFIIPEIEDGKNVVFFVVDCMRLDQWFMMEKEIHDFYLVERDFYYSILPTATPYARNAIFSGLFPIEIEKRFPDLWEGSNDDERSRNKYEKDFLEDLLKRHKVKLKSKLRYFKIIDPDFGVGVEQNITTYAQGQLTAIVVNFVDMLAHGRSDSTVIRELSFDESAYREVTRAWFVHSSFYRMLKTLSRMKNVVVFITTDHGSIRALRGSKVLADREAATNLRYKYGRNLKCDEKEAIFIENPETYKLPKRGVAINYIIAKEDYYFVYPTEYHHYLNLYKDTFQHGGVSLEEMIVPLIKLTPKL